MAASNFKYLLSTRQSIPMYEEGWIDFGPTGVIRRMLMDQVKDRIDFRPCWDLSKGLRRQAVLPAAAK